MGPPRVLISERDMQRECDLSVRFQAFAVAMSAKADMVQRAELEKLKRMADQLGDGPLKRAVTTFLSQLRSAVDHQSRARLGHDLLTFIDALNVPEVPHLNRRDIYG